MDFENRRTLTIKTSRGNERDWLNRLMRGLLALGSAPDSSSARFGLIPVDYVASGAVQIGQASSKNDSNKIYHLSHSSLVTPRDILIELYEVAREDAEKLTSDILQRVNRLVETGCGLSPG